ncbi:MAG: hypothetical protein JXA23_03170 [Bacteroidales bacterium]|nr:hypothetical protein [Bacteroidales bacterium]
MKPLAFIHGVCYQLLIIFFLAGFVTGQNNASLPTHFSIFQWPKESGLPSIIQSMAQSPDGYLWMGCDYGIVRFDGFSSVLYERHSVPQLIQDDCQAIYLAHDSTLYFGLVGGLVVTYKNGNFNQVGDTGTFRGNSITKICEDRSGNLWIGTDGGGVFSYSGNHFRSFTLDDGIPGNGIDALCAGNSGEIWIGAGKGLCRIWNGKVERFTEKDGFLIQGVAALFMDQGGTLWIGGFDGGFMKYHQGIFSSVENPLFPLCSAFRLITEGPDGRLWIGTDSEGLIIFNPADNTTFTLSTADGLAGNMIKCLITDQEGDLLVGIEGEGLNRIRKTMLKNYTTLDGLSDNNIMSLYTSPEGDVWIGAADASIFRYREGRFFNMSEKFNIQVPPVWSIYGSPGNTIWAAGYEGLISSNGRQRTLFPVGQQLQNTLFHTVYSSRDGTVWAGTDAGIYLIKEGEISTLTRADGLTDGRILCFMEDHRGRMWIGTQDGGINILEDGKIRSITTKDGLSDNLILCFFESGNGSVWIGTGHDGLNFIAKDSVKAHPVNECIGYPRSVTYITEDQYGILWIGTHDGIISVSRSDLEESVSGKGEDIEVHHFGQPEGMSGNSCTEGTFPGGCWTPDNKLWFATPEGITEVDPTLNSIPSSFPPLFIQDILVNGKPVKSHQQYNLPPGVIQMEIQYCAPSFIAPDRLQFRYQLEGYDDDWVDAGSRRSAFFTKVPAGDYTFRVQVCNHQGQWSDQETSARIHIRYYFYQTTWFLLLCILIGLFLVYAGIRYRIRYIREKELEVLVEQRTHQLKELNRELDQRVLDRTAELAAANQELEAFTYSVSHDLRAPVRRIEGLVEALNEEYASQLDKTGRDFLNKVADSSTEMGQLIEEFLKLARIARQEIDKTELDLSQMAVEITQELAATDPERKVTLKIQPKMHANGDSRLIRIALLNLLNNAWKYTGKTDQPEILFGSLKEEGDTVFFVQDNGVGFEMNHYDKLFTPFLRLHSDDQFSGTGIGLATVKRIILKHGGKIWAKSEPGNGSTFYFTL